MNRDIAKYVLGLKDRVTPRQHHVLMVLAYYHQMARETYWPSREKLADELSMDESQLRRYITELEARGILQQTPGNGAGKHSGYVFVEFENRDVKGEQKGDKKGDFFDPAIRNYKIFTNTQTHLGGGSSSTAPLPGGFTQADFDQRDLRLLGAAYRKMDSLIDRHANAFKDWPEEKLYAWLAIEAGVMPERIRELESRVGWGRKSPQSEIA